MSFGTQEFGDSGFGLSAFGESGFGGVEEEGELVGLFGSSPFGAEPFGGTRVVTEEPVAPEAPELVRSVQPRGAATARGRFESHIKSPFDTREGSVWDRLLNTIGEEFEDLHTARDEAMLSSYVDTATGAQLDKIGSFVFLPRRHEETDDHYRGRLKVQLRTLIGGGTIPDIKETSAILLGTQPSEVDIIEDFDNEPARFDINFSDQYLSDSTVEVSDFVSFLDEIRAAGVRIFGSIEGSFEYRSVQDFNDGTNDTAKAYNEGAYAGLLIG